ncbi:MAG: sigma-54 dependent transcriptional regulator [Gemmatimonadaceae bacterium]
MLQIDKTPEPGFEGIVGESKSLRAVLRQAGQVAPVETTVLITGETGTGKELIARAIHEASARRARPFVAINCGAIAQGLVESELFGHERGAFTGALQRRIGRFEMADGGTLFLDEVGELPLETQVKLLRVLQEREFERVGSTRAQSVDVRVIAATHRDLEADVAAGRFRADLYYRLNVFPLRMPSLRERAGDIPLLVRHFLQQLQRKLAKPLKSITDESLQRMQGYRWPGNIRELQNILERAAVVADGMVVELAPGDCGGMVPQESGWKSTGEWRVHTNVRAPLVTRSESNGDAVMSLVENERAHIRRAVHLANGRIHGPTGAARMLGINPSTLRSRMQKLGLFNKAS